LSCVDRLKSYFRVEKWQINQPIILSDVASEIFAVEGVGSMVKPSENSAEMIIVENKWGGAYSNNMYDIGSATFNGVLYPSLDPAVFEVRYPDTDIVGRVLGDV